MAAARRWRPGTRLGKSSRCFHELTRPSRNFGKWPIKTLTPPHAANVPTNPEPGTQNRHNPEPSSRNRTGDRRISIDDFMKVELRTAKVIAAEAVPKSKKLIKLQVDLGTEQRTILAGIAEAYQPESLVGARSSSSRISSRRS